jgi:hypothetical protein
MARNFSRHFAVVETKNLELASFLSVFSTTSRVLSGAD